MTLFEGSWSYISIFLSTKMISKGELDKYITEYLNSVDINNDTTENIAYGKSKLSIQCNKTLTHDIKESKRLLVYNNDSVVCHKDPWWMNPKLFYIACLLCLNWPFKWIFYIYTKHTNCLIIKELEMDPNHCSNE